MTEKKKILVKKLSENAFLPEKKTDGAAAYDLYVPEDTTIQRGRNIVGLKISIELPKGYYADVRPRSGYSTNGFEGVPKIKTDLIETRRFDADVILGLVDCDYRGEIGVIVKNHGEPFVVKRGQRIAQMFIGTYNDYEFQESEELSDTDRTGGFGSTGA